jgi:N-acetyltransferase
MVQEERGLVTLQGRHVRLEPLSESHVAGLSAIGLDPSLWEWIPTRVTNADEMLEYIRVALRERSMGIGIPFATVDRASGTVVGCTRFMNIDKTHKRVEIGSTWLAQPWQRSAINTEAK